jgi:ABC-type uncharacterized transport system permease subunit
VGVSVGSFVVALGLVAVVLTVSGIDPASTYRAMGQAAFTDPGSLSSTLIDATPLVLTGLCATVAFRLEIYNIGGEGQLYMGAMGATAVGLLVGNRAPGFVTILAMVIAGALAGALWALIPAALRAFLHTNEILTSLMLNYVAGLFISYLIFDSTSYWRNLSSAAGKVYPTGKTVPAHGWWPTWQVGGVGVPLGFVIGVAVALLLAVALRRTTVGFRVRVAAGSPEAARYSGISMPRMIVLVMILSGAFAGLAGASEVGGFSHLLDPTGLQQAQFGYAGIVVAALAGFEPVAVIITGLLLGAVSSAGTQLAGVAFPAGLVGTMEGIILFTVVSAAVLVLYRVRLTPRGRGRSAADRAITGSTAADPAVAVTDALADVGAPPVALTARTGDS